MPPCTYLSNRSKTSWGKSLAFLRSTRNILRDELLCGRHPETHFAVHTYTLPFFAETRMTRAPIAIAALALCAAALAAEERPLTTLPYTPGLDVNAMDRTADPCGDFYQYSCGGWMKANPIPADQPRWSVYGKLGQDNQRYLWGILEELAAKTAGRNATQQKI